MKNQFQRFLQEGSPACALESVSLRKLVSRVQTNMLPQAVAKRSIIVNEVDESFSVFADEDVLGFLLGCLVSNAICSTTSSCIRVETIRSDKKIQIAVRNNGKFDYCPGMHSLITISNAARKLGGIISLKSEGSGGFTIVLSLSAAS